MSSERPRGNYKERAKRALTQPPVSKSLGNARPGAVFSVPDEHVVFPETRLDGAPERTFHRTRRVIVLQVREQCTSADPLTVIVVPVTCSHRGNVASWDFELPNDEVGFTTEDNVAYTSLIQPMLKSDLGRYEGQLKPETIAKIMARVADNLGFRATEGAIGLPPRGGPASGSMPSGDAGPSSNG